MNENEEIVQRLDEIHATLVDISKSAQLLIDNMKDLTTSVLVLSGNITTIADAISQQGGVES